MKINVKNEEKLNAAIDAIEKGCRVRCIAAWEISDEVDRIEKNLSRRLYKKDWTDLTFLINVGAQNFPSSYKGTPESTQVVVRRFASGWFVVAVKRDVCHAVKVTAISDFTLKKNDLAEFANDSRNW